MRKFLAGISVAAFVVALGVPAFAKTETIKGELVDQACYTKDSKNMGDAHKECAVTCAKNSRHMWGAAADMSLAYETAANDVGFPFVYHENGGTGAHLHVDMQACK